MKKYTEDRLYEIVEELFPNIKWRKFQLETIVYILKEYQENPEGKIIIDAPTGSGKSIISIVTSQVLNSKYFNQTGYILTSDTYLQDQYEETVKQLNVKCPSIKGMNNYDCIVNGNIVSLGFCKEAGIKGEQLYNLPCFNSCEYFVNRRNAVVAGTSILNYNYWLIHQTYVNRNNPNPMFEKRDFVFFDEAHKVVNIVNEHFSPKITSYLKKNISWSLPFLIEKNLIEESEASVLEEELNFCIDALLNENTKDYFEILKQTKIGLGKLYHLKDKVESINRKFSDNKENLPEANRKTYRNLNAIKDNYCKIEDYIELIKRDPKTLLVRTGNENEVSFYSIDTSSMMNSQFHQHYGFGVYMSATFLNHDFFSVYSGIKDVKILKIPSTFDFAKSPVYYSKKYNMSFAKKSESRQGQAEKILEIVEKYPSGVIHTGNYENSRYLEALTKNDKIRFYTNTQEKKQLIAEIKRDKNFFIAGPSLLEGIDLYGDISRCQIFMKIPYLNLGDTFTKRRFENSKQWYSWETALNFVQGIGRSNRFDEDFCDTYILDASFENLLRSYMIPDFILQRIVYI